MIVISRDAVFDETKVDFNHLDIGEPAENTIFPLRPSGIDTETQPIESSQQTDLNNIEPEASEYGNRLSDIGTSSQLDNLPENELSPATVNLNPRPADEQPGPLARRYPTRLQTPSVRLRDFWSLYSESLDEPLSYALAIQQEEWRKAIQNELDSIIKNNTWTVTDRPTGCKPITGKWLFKVKRHSSGLINKLKARIVARRFQQREGTDYSEVFAPIVRWFTILTVLALATKQEWPLWQMDVITAFLNGTINEDLFMEIPDGFLGAGDPMQVCKINRALYRLKQSPKAWYDKIDVWL